MSFTTEEFPFTSEYDSDLRAVLKYIREVKKLLGTYDEVIAELKEELANIQGLYDRVTTLENATADLNEIRAKVDNLITGLEQLNNKEKADIENLQKQIDDIAYNVSTFERRIRDVISYIDYNVAVLENTIKKEVAYLIKVISELDTKLSKQIEYIIWRLDQIDTSVINPWHTNKGRISQDRNVKHIYADLADGCLTAEQYVKLGLTADSYSAFGINARQYAKHGKELLHYYWVYSPVHGWRQDINVVLTDIVCNCKQTMSATRYAELGLTADEYTAIGLTAYRYYEYNPSHVGVYVQDGILQSDQYYIQVIDGVAVFTGIEAKVEDGMLYFE